VDYPPAKEPYLFQREISLFIVNDGGEMIALDHRAENLGGMPIHVNWISEEKSFINPPGGTHYDLKGCPFRWALNFKSVSPMIRYPVVTQQGQIFVIISEPFPPCKEMLYSLTIRR